MLRKLVARRSHMSTSWWIVRYLHSVLMLRKLISISLDKHMRKSRYGIIDYSNLIGPFSGRR